MHDLLSPDNRLFTLARSGKRLPPVWLAILLGTVGLIALLLVGTVVGSLLAGTLLPGFADDDGAASPVRAALGQDVTYIAQFGVPLLALWGWVRAYEGRGFASLGFASPAGGTRYGRGFALGVLSFAAVIGLLVAFGASRGEGDPARQGVAVLGGVLLVLVGWLFQGGAEEIITRGWLLGTVGARSRPWVGVLASAAVFGLLHALNPNVTVLGILNTILVGLFLALYALAEGGIWGVCAWHGAWNWAQGNVFGISVSGQTALGGTLADFVTTGPDWLTGGAYGVEAGLAATAVILLGIALILVVARGRVAAFA